MHTAIVFGVLVFVLTAELFAQPIHTRNDNARSSRGRDFYMVFLPNFHEETTRDSANTRDSLFLFITCDKPTNGRITYRTRLRREVVRPFSIANPAQIFTLALNYGDIELEGFNASQLLNRNAQNNQIAPQYVRVQAEDEVTVYALNQ
ncbi:MAG: hypothetical protein RML40_09745, partial [Bacteroidota bacterium]|nr:hypothetical protein [Candidatus Kapabacteria bacterium]MDW8220800.1 hypothetical protein [Bacteroidota bacterium]